MAGSPRVLSQSGDARPTITPTFADFPIDAPKAPDNPPTSTPPPFSDNPVFTDLPPAIVFPTTAFDARATLTPSPPMDFTGEAIIAPGQLATTMTVTVQLQGRPADLASVEVSVSDGAGGPLGTAEYDPVAGVFTLIAPLAQTYLIAADAPLHRRVEVTYSPGDESPALLLQGGDLDGDGCIGPADLAHLLREFAKPGDPATDITGDGLTDTSDLAILAGNFDPACEFTLQAMAPIATPTPAFLLEPTSDLSPTPTQHIVNMLFVDSFDDGSGWLAAGGWKYDATAGYNGGGWWTDATARGQASTLTYVGAIDLQTAPAPQLVFWQQGVLDSGDVVAVDISFDGGGSWIMVDRQIGLASGWSRRTIDLTVCRGQVIGLRFRLETEAGLPDGMSAPGYWLDEVVIVRAGDGSAPTATFEPTASPTPSPGASSESTSVPAETLTNTPLPTVTFVSSATPTWTPTPLPVMLPWYESFDSGQGWLASGTWQSVTPAFQGAGWFADSVPRDQVSLLNYGAAIDLTTAIHPRLSFAFRASLSPVDSFSIDVSLDGGVSWSVIEQQTALVTDWVVRDFDLTSYRGYPIRLRFRLDASSTLPENMLTVGVWIDELAIQEMPATPIPTDTPIPVEPPPPIMTPTPTASSSPPLTATMSPVPTAVTPLPTTDLTDSIQPTPFGDVLPDPLGEKPTVGPPIS